MDTHRITLGRGVSLAVLLMVAVAAAPAAVETPKPGRRGNPERGTEDGAADRGRRSGGVGTGWEPTRNSEPVQDTAAALHLLRRATYGVRAEDLAAVLAMGRDAWLDRQLHPDRIADDAIADRLESFPTASMSMTALMLDYLPLPRPDRPAADSMSGDATPSQDARQAADRERRRGRARMLPDLVGARLTQAVHSERQLEGVMTEFWFNHFNVYFAKGLDRYFIADYERTAIRPHVFGRFEDMLLATAQHPAMLFYLDNWTSVVPDSLNPRVQRPRARRRERGINENYARELLELHTLGVDGGYTQRDVLEVARALTGWSFRRPNVRAQMEMMMAGPREDDDDAAVEEIAFWFRRGAHDAGEKVVLGQTLPAGRGSEDGVDVIRMLARHPSTAKFIATKLVERFVNDEPDSAFVDELADVFLETDGDLREVTRALFTSDRFYDSRYVGAKVKTPYELVASALRVTRADGIAPRGIIATLRALGNLPYSEPAPTGYPASSEDWVNAGAMLNRMSFGLALAEGELRGIRVDARALAGAGGEAETRGRVGEARTGGRDGEDSRRTDSLPQRGRAGVGVVAQPEPHEPDWLADLLAVLLPGVHAPELEDAINADLARRAGRTEDLPRAQLARAVGLVIGSPEFQMR